MTVWLANAWGWLNENQGAMATLATVALAVLTWLNVRAAGNAATAATRSAESSEHLIQLETLPVVLGGIEGQDFLPNHYVLFDAVNVGQGVAINPEFSLKTADDLLGAVGMEHLPPLAERGRVRMAVSQAMFDSVGREAYWVVVEYRDALGRRYRTERDAFGAFFIVQVEADGAERAILGT